MMGWTEVDSKNLERIAVALERLVSHQEQNHGLSLNVDALEVEKTVLEADFFSRVTRVYYNEQLRVERKGGSRKAPRAVASQFAVVYPEFFEEHLPDFEVESVKGGLLIFRKDNQPVCALKIYTDIGYGARGEDWYDNIDFFVNVASSYGISADKVFFLVISFQNGLDNQHVRKVLGEDITNKELLNPKNRAKLEEYARMLAEGAKVVLPDPSEQIFFLAGKLHPNVLEEALAEDLENYEWLRPSVTELVQKIREL